MKIHMAIQLPILCVKISILRHRRMWVRSFSTRLTSVTFAEDKVLGKLVLGLWLDSELHYFSIFTENKKTEHLIFCECHGRPRTKRTHTCVYASIC